MYAQFSGPARFARPDPGSMTLGGYPRGFMGPTYGTSILQGGPEPGRRVEPRLAETLSPVARGPMTVSPQPLPSSTSMSTAGGMAALLGVGGFLFLLALSLPIASSFVFGKKYGGPGYILGFFVPMAIGALIARLRGK